MSNKAVDITKRKNVCLMLLIGLPGSGKTELCKLILSKLPILLKDHSLEVEHVCYDQLLTEELNDGEWRNARDKIMCWIQQHIQNLMQCSKLEDGNMVILIDDNMYYKSMRRMYYRLTRKLNYAFCQLFVQCDVVVAVSRVKNRACQPGAVQVTAEEVQRMATRLEPPDTSSNWEAYSLTVDTSMQTLDGDKTFHYCVNGLHGVDATVLAVHQLVKDSFARHQQIQSHKPEVVKNQLLPSPALLLQDLDVCLRKFISTEMQAAKAQGKESKELTTLAKKLNDKRRTCLDNASRSTLKYEDFDHYLKHFSILPEEL